MKKLFTDPGIDVDVVTLVPPWARSVVAVGDYDEFKWWAATGLVHIVHGRTMMARPTRITECRQEQWAKTKNGLWVAVGMLDTTTAGTVMYAADPSTPVSCLGCLARG